MNTEAALPSFPLLSGVGFRLAAVRRVGAATAFTLVELLVTMAVGTILIVFLFQLFSASMRAWRQSEDQVETYREARAALQIMVRDLSQTVAPMTASVYPSSTSSPSPTPTPSSLPKVVAPVLVLDYYDNNKPSNGDEINEEAYCLTTIPNNGVSQLCAVGYFCAWKPELYADQSQKDRAPRAYSLMRQYLGSGAPASGGNPAVPGLYDRFYEYGNTTPLTFVQVFDRVLPPQSSAGNPPKATATELAAYVWDLQIRVPSASQTASATSAYPAKKTYSTDWPNALPAYVEVRFKALSESAARQLAGNASVTRATWNDANISSAIYQKIILPGTRQFSARVPIYSGSATATPSP